MKKRSIAKRILLIITIIVAICTCLAMACSFVNPNAISLAPFLSISFPILFVLNLLLFLLWVFLNKKTSLLPLLVAIIGITEFSSYLQIGLSEKYTSAANDIKVMSYNVRVFDLYMWTEEKKTRNDIFSFFDKEQPDILCIQEFYQDKSKNSDYEFKTLDTLVKFLKAKNYHVQYTGSNANTSQFGLITFSKYPIINKGKVAFNERSGNMCIYSDLKINEDTVRVFNAHLASLRLGKRDYKSVKNTEDNSMFNNQKEIETVFGKLANGFKVRAKQADSIHKAIVSTKHPILFCGDFNDTPTSYAYKTIKGSLNDAFKEKGNGIGGTYIGNLPPFRIDYILPSTRFEVKHFKTHKVKLSDHKPISTIIELK